tara:strand:- start:1364 stop:2239 length:876 start_codon:yes stop_codon:yes gene_type:complete
MAHKKQYTDNFADLVARLNKMSNITPEEERTSLLEAASAEPKILDDKEVSLADIAKLAGIKEYAEPVKHSAEAEKLVESIVAEPKTESDISKAIKEADADDSISTSIKKEVNEEVKRLDKIAELETQLAQLKSQEKEDATMDDKAFREVFLKDITEFVKEADANDLVEMYNTFSGNEVEANENAFIIKTPETKEIIADAEQAEAPEEQVDEKVKDFVDYDRNKEEPHSPEKDGGEEAEDKSDEKDTDGEVDMLDPEFDEGEDVELDTPANEVVEEPAEDKFTNDLDPADKK